MRKIYLAFLRGINVSGKNRIAMPELRQAMQDAGFPGTLTLLNSGNAVFACEEKPTAELEKTLTEMIRQRFELDVPVLVIGSDELSAIVEQAPEWWGLQDPAVYHNLILLFAPATTGQVIDLIGQPKAELEQIHPCGQAIFWSFDLAKHAQTIWWSKTAAPGIGNLMTIRTAGTIRKVLDLSRKLK